MSVHNYSHLYVITEHCVAPPTGLSQLQATSVTNDVFALTETRAADPRVIRAAHHLDAAAAAAAKRQRAEISLHA